MSAPVNYCSSLLTSDEQYRVDSLLGNKCSSLCTTVVQLYLTAPPLHNQWMPQEIGVLCFVKDNVEKNFFFRLYCIDRNFLVWEQGLYYNLEYNASTTFFHIFEGEHSLVGFNFANSFEASDFKQIVLRKIQQRNARQERRMAKSTAPLPPQNTSLSASTLSLTTLPTSSKKSKKKKRKDKENKKKLTGRDISTPVNFQHIQHVGFDKDNGFDLENLKDEKLRNLFQMAGISEKELQDTETKHFIASFIKENGGIDAVNSYNNQINNRPVPPPPTQRTESLAGRPPNYPPPVLPSTHKKTPTLPKVSKRPPPLPSRPPPNSESKNPPSAPPPPPPPPPELSPPGEYMSVSIDDIEKNAIQQVAKNNPVADSRGLLMDEIRKGTLLKPTNQREIKSSPKPAEASQPNDLAAALAKAMDERRPALMQHFSDESDSSIDDDEEWE